MPARALTPLARQAELAPERLVRNRISWQLDRIDALLELRETGQACAELLDATASPVPISPRALRRLRVVELRLRSLPRTPTLEEPTEQLRAFTEAFA
jgi:hypothetical protein